MNNPERYKCGSIPQVGDTVKSDSEHTCLLHIDTPYEVLSVNEDKSKVYIKLPIFYNGLVYPTRWFSLISRKVSSMKINVEAPARSVTIFGDLKGGDWFTVNGGNYYLKLSTYNTNDSLNAVRHDGVKAIFLITDRVTKVIDPVLTGRLES